MGTKEIERCISSSASIHSWKYDVFVSFKGEDIRKTFAAHLFHALKQAGIYYFRDNHKVETGIFIEPKLLDAIRHSRVALIVFTTNYADSQWCLNELVEILECNRRFRDHQGHVILPIFYDVEPGDVRKQSGRFEDGFRRCLATHTDDLLVLKWRDALKEAGNLSGWHFNNDANGDQSNFIEQIVGHLLRVSLRPISPYFVKNAIGVDSFVEDVLSLLEIGSEDDVRVVGIWGMKGIVRANSSGGGGAFRRGDGHAGKLTKGTNRRGQQLPKAEQRLGLLQRVAGHSFPVTHNQKTSEREIEDEELGWLALRFGGWTVSTAKAATTHGSGFGNVQ
ncbi:hypothetical protein NL676_008101 [Syzygium grande]|nr:hypothetical protein NL676_008101 [Syzygium grande]